ncbi:Gfo/Idh/MocA family protein [Kumtagia ephedrae]|uniref:Oxidoreductase n=1 Tax=Kumtagia ephedrae TaxID=2116701 RepID=A0A2P7S8N0_9HYPH|nr:Gfo/Idh/MocA family oxidoreductase [Mesorhizobium ephedrae]PSJ58827.1 oxidoreductase [Mesorhizobium ephedrae]
MAPKPRLGFLGVGWIGRHRMQAVLDAGLGEACAICDTSAQMAAAARDLAPDAAMMDTLEALLDTGPDGVLIATPSALHARQSIRALESGVAVFCQKPLGRDAREVAAVLDAARRADRLIAVDLSYRHTRAMQAVRDRIGSIGAVFAADLVFHNAYGPDKPWFYDPELSGGGCVMDLGVHLVDLLLWTLDFPAVDTVSADLFAGGSRISGKTDVVEDYAVVTLGLEGGATARLACSWRLHAGCEAVISATFYGTEGTLVFSNVGGSFYDFVAELRRGTRSETLLSPPDAWGGRAAVDWAERLAAGCGFDAEAERLIQVSEVLDRVYASARKS